MSRPNVDTTVSLPAVRSSRVARAYDSLASRYDAMYHDAWDQAEEDFLRERIVSAVLAAPGAMLDVGCGTGHVLDLAGHVIRDYAGADVSVAMLAEASRKHPGHSFGLEDADSPGFWRGRSPLGIVAATHVACYVDVPRLLRGAAAVLRPGGRVILCGYGGAWFRREHRTGSGRITLPLAVPADAAGWEAAALAAGFRHVAVYGVGRWSRWRGLPVGLLAAAIRREAARMHGARADTCWHVVLEAAL